MLPASPVPGIGDSTTVADSLGHSPVAADSIGAIALSPAPAGPRDSALGIPAAPRELPGQFLPSPFAMITNLPGDWIEWSGNSFQPKYLPLMGIIAATTTAAVVTDDTYQPIRREYQRTSWFHEASDYAVWIGDGKFQFGLAGAFAAYGFLFDDTTALRTASQTTEVILACGAVVQLLKHLTGRESPFVATTPTGRWALFPDQIDYMKHTPHYDAYPSGHVATALATLTVIAENYPGQKWIRWIGYPAIGALAVGMVAQGIHWWSDYPLSIVLGYSFGMLVSHRGDPAADRSLESRLLRSTTFSLLSDGTPAVGLAWSW
jgi:membrane-associated phospholipid phosphatase